MSKYCEPEFTAEDMSHIASMADSTPWTETTCPCCNGKAEVRTYGLKSVALTGDETLARREYRRSNAEAIAALERVKDWATKREGWECCSSFLDFIDRELFRLREGKE